jgi:large subunit ribosomal protein L13
MKTYSAKPSEVTRKWYIIDASTVPLGRISTVAASLLLGKGKPQFTKHIDCGDYVIILNAKDLLVSGDKLKTKMYYHHSQHPGGLRERSLEDQLALDPTKVIFHSVRGMLPDNKLLDGRLARLKIYVDDQHKHDPQKPEIISLGEKRG